ncbi:MAG: hypothetical protein ACLRSW_06045 [Christensenellaceae bacterium]
MCEIGGACNFDDLSRGVQYSEIVSSTPSRQAPKVTCNGWQMIAVYPEYYDLGGFDKLQIR